MKRCSCCQQHKPLSAFYSRKGSSDGVRGQCKECVLQRQSARKEAKARYDRERYVLNRDRVLERVKASYDPEKKARYDRDRAAERNARRRHRYKTDLNYKLRCNLRARLYGALRRGRKSARTMDLLGCTIEHLKKHLEEQFTDGMTWQGIMDGDIHVDHIKPCASFDLSDPVQQRECFHYSNLQPLWAEDNRKKYTSIDG